MTSTKFRFDHVGFITPDMDHALATYRALGCQLEERHYRRDDHDLAFMSAGTDVLMEFQAPPLLEESKEYVARQGWSIERVAFVCDDVQKAYDDLMAAGVKSAWEPEPFIVDGLTIAIAAGVWSPEGMMIDIVQHENVAVPRPERGDRGELALHHACFLTPDLAAAEKFWTSHFGLTKVLDFTAPLPPEDGGPADGNGTKGFVMLGDSEFDAGNHEFCLEIIGGEFDAIDGPAYTKRGPHYDHVCFTTDDVAGVWQRAVDLGVEPLSAPAYYEEYDGTIAWLYDADGTHIELLSTIPPEEMTEAHRTGVCSSQWVDDWQRDPEVFPRKGGQPVQVKP